MNLASSTQQHPLIHMSLSCEILVLRWCWGPKVRHENGHQFQLSWAELVIGSSSRELNRPAVRVHLSWAGHQFQLSWSELLESSPFSELRWSCHSPSRNHCCWRERSIEIRMEETMTSNQMVSPFLSDQSNFPTNEKSNRHYFFVRSFSLSISIIHCFSTLLDSQYDKPCCSPNQISFVCQKISLFIPTIPRFDLSFCQCLVLFRSIDQTNLRNIDFLFCTNNDE